MSCSLYNKESTWRWKVLTRQPCQPVMHRVPRSACRLVARRSLHTILDWCHVMIFCRCDRSLSRSCRMQVLQVGLTRVSFRRWHERPTQSPSSEKPSQLSALLERPCAPSHFTPFHLDKPIWHNTERLLTSNVMTMQMAESPCLCQVRQGTHAASTQPPCAACILTIQPYHTEQRLTAIAASALSTQPQPPTANNHPWV